MSRPERGLQKNSKPYAEKHEFRLIASLFTPSVAEFDFAGVFKWPENSPPALRRTWYSMATIHKMGQRWKAKNSCSFVSTPNPLPIMSRVTSAEASELLSENKALRRRLEEALLRLEGYEIMGDILQEEYGVDLLKKSAAGQSSVSKKDTQQ